MLIDPQRYPSIYYDVNRSLDISVYGHVHGPGIHPMIYSHVHRPLDTSGMYSHVHKSMDIPFMYSNVSSSLGISIPSREASRVTYWRGLGWRSFPQANTKVGIVLRAHPFVPRE